MKNCNFNVHTDNYVFWTTEHITKVDFPCGPLSLSSSSYIAGYFRLVAQSAATSSRWFPARGFFYREDGGDTFLPKRRLTQDLHSATSHKTTFFKNKLIPVLYFHVARKRECNVNMFG
jgi:hypothetical protein